MIPEGWEKTSLKEVLSGPIKNGYSPIASDKETGHWILSLAALGDDGLNPTAIKPVEPTEKIINSLLMPGDFLISRSNTPDKVGRSACFKGEVENCSYPDLMMRFTVEEDIVDSRFIEVNLKSSLVRSYFKKCAAGSSSTMVKINKSVVENTPLLLPPLHEQTKIANILSTWDKAIETVEKLIENSRAQKKALMQQLLTGKRRLPGFKNKWQRVSIGKMGKIMSGGTPDTGKHSYWDGSIAWATPTDITALRSRFIEKTKRTISPDGVKNSSAQLLPLGSILVCTRATIGYLAIAANEITTNQGFKSLIPSEKFDSDFLYYLFKYHKHDFVRYACGSTFLEISKKDFSKRIFFAPDIKEQKQIAKVLNNAGDDIRMFEKDRDYLVTEKKSLMQQLLTGKRRVKT